MYSSQCRCAGKFNFSNETWWFDLISGTANISFEIGRVTPLTLNTSSLPGVATAGARTSHGESPQSPPLSEQGAPRSEAQSEQGVPRSSEQGVPRSQAQSEQGAPRAPPVSEQGGLGKDAIVTLGPHSTSSAYKIYYPFNHGGGGAGLKARSRFDHIIGDRVHKAVGLKRCGKQESRFDPGFPTPQST